MYAVDENELAMRCKLFCSYAVKHIFKISHTNKVAGNLTSAKMKDKLDFTTITVLC